MPAINYNEEELKTLLNNISKELPDAVVESGYYIDGKKLIITKGNDGYIVNTDATAKKIVEKLSNFNYINEVIELETIQKSPDEINIDKIYSEVHKEPKDASFEPETHTITSAENGIDFMLKTQKKYLKHQIMNAQFL